jgi:cytochrome c oxidase subunit IV
MSDPHTTNPTDDPHGIKASADSPALLLIVFAVVVGLAMANVGLSMALGPTPFTLPLQLLIGSIQAGLVAYYFMHLKQGDGVVILTALSSIFWMGILFVLFMGDYMTRHMLVGSW